MQDGRVEVVSTLLVRVTLRALVLKERLLVPMLLLMPSDRASLQDGFWKRIEDDRRALAAYVR